MDGLAKCGGFPGTGLPLDCRVELRKRGFAPQTTDLRSICTDGDHGRCRFGSWIVQLQRSGETVTPSRVAPPAEPSCAAEQRVDYFLGILTYRRCASGEIEVGSLRLAGVEDISDRGTLIGTDATWMVVLLRRGDRESLGLLRIDDASPVSLAWESELKAADAWEFRFDDFDHDGNPELHFRARGEPARSIRIDAAGNVVRWDGKPSHADQEMCRWLASRTGSATCDPWLDASIDERPLADGTKFAVVQEPKLWLKNYGPSALFAIRGEHAELVQELRGGLVFEPARPGCFWHHLLFAFFDDTERLCLQGGVLKQE